MAEMKILGATIHGLDMVETICCVDNYIALGRKALAKEQDKAVEEATAAKEKILHHIITLNAEILYVAQSDEKLLSIINQADLVTPDGSGIVWACKELCGQEIQRVTGIDLMQEICQQSKVNHWKVFLFGAKPGVADEAGKKLEKQYGTLVAGMAHGYFKPEDEEAIIERINASGADVLFLALGAPKQEFWIHRYRDRLKVPVVIGVGGSFDVIAGTVKRAPVFFQKIGMEWLWRLIKEPWRYKRMMALPKFVRLVKKEVKRRNREAYEKSLQQQNKKAK